MYVSAEGLLVKIVVRDIAIKSRDTTSLRAIARHVESRDARDRAKTYAINSLTAGGP